MKAVHKRRSEHPRSFELHAQMEDARAIRSRKTRVAALRAIKARALRENYLLVAYATASWLTVELFGARNRAAFKRLQQEMDRLEKQLFTRQDLKRLDKRSPQRN